MCKMEVNFRVLFLLIPFFLITSPVSSETEDAEETEESDQFDIRELLPDMDDIGKNIDGNQLKTDLWLVGTYIAAHKYFGADFRYLAGSVEPEDQVFYKKFPSPTLRDLHPGVSSACESSASECVDEVLEKAMGSGSLQHLMKSQKKLDTFAPFENNFEEFKYRQTAMYYLCWHTQLRDSFLEFDKGDTSCLAHLNAVDEIPAQRRYNLVVDEEPAIEDIRDIGFKEDKFTCAHLWFCPDPCYGRNNGGNFYKGDFKSSGNPCIHLKDSECNWKKGANGNFNDLIKNKFNITCNCESENKGFEWNSRFGMCVDVDECFDGKDDCAADRVCKNTVGDYTCSCPRGYDTDLKTDECVRMLTLHQSATILKSNGYQSEDKAKEDEDFLLELMDFVGLSAGHTFHISSCTYIICFIIIRINIYLTFSETLTA